MPDEFPPSVPKYFQPRDFVEDVIDARTALQDGEPGIHVVLDGKSYFIKRAIARRFARFILFDEDRSVALEE